MDAVITPLILVAVLPALAWSSKKLRTWWDSRVDSKRVDGELFNFKFERAFTPQQWSIVCEEVEDDPVLRHARKGGELLGIDDWVVKTNQQVKVSLTFLVHSERLNEFQRRWNAVEALL